MVCGFEVSSFFGLSIERKMSFFKLNIFAYFLKKIDKEHF